MDETGEIADAITACVVETMNTSTEVTEPTTFYALGIENVWVGLITISALFIIFRLAILFVNYIKTGEIGDFQNDCFVFNTLDGNFKRIVPAMVFGVFPGAILIDIVGFSVITIIIAAAWGLLAILLPIIGIAYLIRRPIARKQEFIAKLDGTHKNINTGSGEDCGP